MTTSERGERLLVAVARLQRWATRHADMKIPSAQGRLLSLVQEIGPSRIGDLAQADHCSQPTMTTQVQRLEKLGWLTRRPDPDDARAWLVEITPDGTDQLSSARDARTGAIRELLASLSQEEQDVLEEAAAIMQKMVRIAGD